MVEYCWTWATAQHKNARDWKYYNYQHRGRTRATATLWQGVGESLSLCIKMTILGEKDKISVLQKDQETFPQKAWGRARMRPTFLEAWSLGLCQLSRQCSPGRRRTVMMLGKRCVAVEVSCAARCQDTHGGNISSHLFSCHCNSLLFFRGGWAEGGTKKTWLLSLPFFPNPHSEGFHSALRYLFPAKKERKQKSLYNLVHLYSQTEKHKGCEASPSSPGSWFLWPFRLLPATAISQPACEGQSWGTTSLWCF